MTSPYKDQKLYRVVKLEPYQMNNSIKDHLMENLKKSIEYKCIHVGYICKIYKILSYVNGEMKSVDFSGKAYYDVTYLAKLCSPIQKSVILCKVTSTSKSLLEVVNGPINVFIQTTNYSTTKFKINSNGDLCDKETEKIIEIDDIIKVELDAPTYNIGASEIMAVGNLQSMATKEEIEEFKEQQCEKIAPDTFVKKSKINIDLSSDGESDK